MKIILGLVLILKLEDAQAYHNNNKTIYDKIISNVEKFLSGKTKSIVKNIKKDMEIASDEQNYERAAVLRDRINAIENARKTESIRNKERNF